MTGPEARSPQPGDDHLDLDALADVLAGERPDDRHVRTCPVCAERLAELQGAEVTVVASLATLPDPALPDGLAERLATAVRAEPRHPQPAAVTTLPVRRRRAWLPAAAASVALVLAGIAVVPALRGGTEAGRTASTAGGAGDRAEQPAEGGGPPAVRNDSGVDYRDEARRAEVLPDVLAGTADGRQPATDQDPLAPLREPARLEACLSSLVPPEDPALRPLALDYARYGRTPALAVVLPDTDPDKVSLYVVGPGCSAADSALLLFARLDRP